MYLKCICVYVILSPVVNVRHGWELPEDIHEEHLRQINEACINILRRMPRFDWDLYEKGLAKKGLRLKVKRDRTGQVVSYVIMMGNSKFKASELGTSRNLTVKNIETTWNKLHRSSLLLKTKTSPGSVRNLRSAGHTRRNTTLTGKGFQSR